jgi:hypothetical protein
MVISTVGERPNTACHDEHRQYDRRLPKSRPVPVRVKRHLPGSAIVVLRESGECEQARVLDEDTVAFDLDQLGEAGA